LLNARNRNISTGELASITGLTSKQVEYRINVLKKNGKLERSGAKKNGEWIVKN
jgi:predicted HTH transcriptional regulator